MSDRISELEMELGLVDKPMPPRWPRKYYFLWRAHEDSRIEAWHSEEAALRRARELEDAQSEATPAP